MPQAIVVGAGLGGLSAAAHLLADGHDVTIYERSAAPGGRAGLVADAGFLLDTGPAVLTMPEIVEETFAAVGADMAELCPLDAVDPMYRAVFADGAELRVWHDRSVMTDEIATLCGPREAAAFGRFCDWLAELYHAQMPHLIDANFDGATDLARRAGAVARVARLRGFGKLDHVIRRFFRDERLRRVFSFQSMYAGLAPYEALALYAVITYMDCVRGVFAPRGGMHRLSTSLADALQTAGVQFRYDTAVDQIIPAGGGRSAQVRLEGGDVERADVVVCNADLPVAYRELLDGANPPRAARRGRYSPSCLLWVAGVRGEAPPGAGRHNIHFSSSWDDSFRQLIHDGTAMRDPSVLVTMHSVQDRTLAPDGCSTIYALEPMPNLDGSIDWARDGDALRHRLRSRVDASGYPTDTLVERWFDPLRWRAMGMERGTPFALAHTFFQTGPFRPNNVDRRVPGVVFTGSSTLPGVGVPMVLISGKLAAARAREMRAGAR